MMDHVSARPKSNTFGVAASSPPEAFVPQKPLSLGMDRETLPHQGLKSLPPLKHTVPQLALVEPKAERSSTALGDPTLSLKSLSLHKIAQQLVRADPVSITPELLQEISTAQRIDRLAYELLLRGGSAWLRKLRGDVRMQLLRSVLEGDLSDEDQDVYNALSPFALGTIAAERPQWVAEARKLIESAEQRIGAEEALEDGIRLYQDETFSDLDLLGQRLMAHPNRGPLIELVFRQLKDSNTDDLARSMLRTVELETLKELPPNALSELLRALRQGWVSEQDAKLFNALVASCREKMVAAAQKKLKNPATRTALRSLLLAKADTPPKERVSFQGVAFNRLGIPVTERQALIELFFKLIRNPLNKRKARRADAAAAASGKDEKIGNVDPISGGSQRRLEPLSPAGNGDRHPRPGHRGSQHELSEQSRSTHRQSGAGLLQSTGTGTDPSAGNGNVCKLGYGARRANF